MLTRLIQVSLVIPVRNESLSISSLIRSINQQTRPPDEILFVDGGSTDQTISLSRELTCNDPRFRLIEAGQATPGRGRNVGIAAASFDWIALTDAGIELEPTWLQQMLSVIEQDPDFSVVYGNYEPNRNTFFEKCAALVYVPAKQSKASGQMRGPSIASALLNRDVWKKVGGFPDLRAAEDLIFMERIDQAGFKIGWAPQATVRWQLQPTFASTFRKFALYSKHNVLAGRARYWHYGVARQYLLVFPFVLLGILWHPLWFVILVLWFCVRVAKSVWQKQEDRSLWGFLNPIQFLTIGLILMTIDIATFVGWAQALLYQGAQKMTSGLPETMRE